MTTIQGGRFPNGYQSFYGGVPFRPGGSDPELSRALMVERAADLIADGATAGCDGTIPAGFTYLGQHIAHELTQATTCGAGAGAEARAHVNQRTPAFDLDSLYSGVAPREGDCYLAIGAASPSKHPDLGSADEPDLPRAAERLALLEDFRGEFVFDDAEVRNVVGRDYLRLHEGDCVRGRRAGGTEHELIPVPPGKIRRVHTDALLGAPKNDDNLLVAQLHLALLRLHNRVADDTAGVGDQRFVRAKGRVGELYQEAVIDFTRELLGPETYSRLTEAVCAESGPEWDRIARIRDYEGLPAEFAFAAFRMGHSMVRSSYWLNERLPGPVPLRLDPSGPLGWDSDLRGGRPLPANWTVQWNLFVDFPDVPTRPQRCRRIDAILDAPLAQLDDGVSASLAERTLVAGLDAGLPSGASVARELGLEGTALDAGEMALWEYVLREAADEQGPRGQHLGPVGGTIVGETLLAVLLRDRSGVLAERDGRRAALSTERGFAKLLRNAGVPITRDDLPQ